MNCTAHSPHPPSPHLLKDQPQPRIPPTPARRLRSESRGETGGAVTLFSPWHFASSPDSPSTAKLELLPRGPHLRLGRQSGNDNGTTVGVQSLSDLTARPWPRAVQREGRASAGSASRRSAWPAGKRSFRTESDPRGSERDCIIALTC